MHHLISIYTFIKFFQECSVKGGFGKENSIVFREEDDKMSARFAKMAHKSVVVQNLCYKLMNTETKAEVLNRK